MRADDPDKSGGFLRTDPSLIPRLDVLSVDAEWLLGRVWLYCARLGNDGRLHVDELPAACARKITPARIRKALDELRRFTFDSADGVGGTVTLPMWLEVDAGFVQLPEWWREKNPPAKVWNDDTARWRWLRNKRLNNAPCAALRADVKKRDRSLCRYCGVRVQWGDQRSPTGGTYDHVDPDEDNTLSNVVVACRRCNGRKRDRTPEQWIAADPAEGLSLLRPGTTAETAAAQRASSRGDPPEGSTQVEPGSNPPSRPLARPPRSEPGSNPARSAEPVSSSRSRSAEPDVPPPPTDADYRR